MFVRGAMAITLLMAGCAATASGCGRMVLVGEVDGAAADGDTDTDGDTGTDTDSATDTSSDTEPAECSWINEDLGELYSVWGASANAVFAVGGTYDIESIAIGYDGVAWNPLPEHGLGPMVLKGVWGASADDVFVVCDAFIVLRYSADEWSGYWVEWNALSAIWGSSADNVYAVGGIPLLFLPPLVSRFDGADWISDYSVPGRPLFDVWGSSASNVYAVGLETLIHSSGTGWSEVDTGLVPLGGTALQGVWGSSSNDIWVVGDHWGSEPVLLYYDGDQWQGIPLGGQAVGADLRGVHGTDGGNVWIVGEQDGAGIALRFDGSIWSVVEDHDFPFPLNDVWVAPTGEVFTVGDEGAIYCVY